jgi:hypothetical protein
VSTPTQEKGTTMTTPDELRAQAAALEAKAAEIETPLSKADVERMFKERRYDEIRQCRVDGRMAGLLGPTTPTEGAS